MRNFAIITYSLLLISLNSACMAQNDEKPVSNVHSKNVEVYYFHYTKRCATCNAIEKTSSNSIKSLYPDGTILFKSINLDEEKNEILAKKLGVSGQSLLIVKGLKTVDITNQGFLYARTKPEKLKAEIKNAIETL